MALTAALAVLVPGALGVRVLSRTESHLGADARARVANANSQAQRAHTEEANARRAVTALLGRQLTTVTLAELPTALAHTLGTAGLTSAQVVTGDGTVEASTETHPTGPCPLVTEAELGNGRRLVATFAQGCPLESSHRAYGNTVEVWWAAWAVALLTVLASALAWSLGRPVAVSLAALVAAAERVGAGDFGVRLRPRRNDAIGEALIAFDQMVEELSLARERMDYLQRLAGWRDVARRLAHEIKNPLTPIQLAVQELARRYTGDDAKYKRTVETAREVVEEEIASLRRMVSAFSDFAQLPEVKTASADLGEFVRDMGTSRAFLDEAAGTDRRADVSVSFEPGDAPLPVSIDRGMLRRACDNLVRNAVQAIEQRGGPGETPKGTVWVRALAHTGDDGPEGWLVVEDDGPGIPAVHHGKVFDPYFTTKAEGTGLGLAIVRKIALDHAGDVGLEDRVGGGARFIITLPLRDGRPRRLSFVTFSGADTLPRPV